MPFNFGEVPFNPGDTAVVNCVATKGDLPLDISWTFSSETMDSSLQRDITTMPVSPRTSMLTINSVSANHQGNYTCIVQNAAGRAEYAATLVVNGTSKSDIVMMPTGSLIWELTPQYRTWKDSPFTVTVLYLFSHKSLTLPASTIS